MFLSKVLKVSYGSQNVDLDNAIREKDFEHLKTQISLAMRAIPVFIFLA